MKVLLLLDSLWAGGTERSLVELLPYLLEAGIRPSVVCFQQHPGEDLVDQVPADRVDVTFLPARRLVERVRALRSLLRRERPDILHSSLFTADLTGRLAAAGLPVVVLNSLVNTSYEPGRFADPRIRRWRLRAVQLVDALTARLLVDHFHAVSRATRDSAVQRLGLPPQRITVVWRGRAPERLGRPSEERRRRVRSALGVAPGAPVVLQVGRQEFQKGQIHLLRAAARLRTRHPDLRVLVAGRRGHASADLEAEARHLGLGEHLHLLGHREDVPELLAAADIFALPSLFEGYPGALVEAMGLSLPVVASDIPPVREVVEPGRSARLVEPGSDEELATALDALLADPEEASRLGRRGRQLFLDHHRTEAVAPGMVGLYRRLARGG